MKVKQRSFLRNVLTLSSGTALAQIINMGFSMIITRLYGPEAFGELGTFLSLTAIFIPIAALTYPIAIMLPKSDKEARLIARLALTIAIGIALITLSITGFWPTIISPFITIGSINNYLILIPIVLFFNACIQTSEQWLLRKALYKITARIAVIQAILLNSINAIAGIYYPYSTTLILIAVFGYVLNSLMLAIGVKTTHSKETENREQTESLWNIACQYSDHAFYRAPQVFINAISQGLPVIMLATFFGASAAGFYTLAKRIMEMPTNLIAKSVGDVYYSRIVQAKHNNENLHAHVLRGTLILAAIGIIPYGIVFSFGPFLFGLIFGSEWTFAGEYAKWLALWLYFGFISRPCQAAIPVIGAQKGLLLYEIISTPTKIAALYAGFVFFNDSLFTITIFSLVGAYSYLFLIVWIMLKTKNIKTCNLQAAA